MRIPMSLFTVFIFILHSSNVADPPMIRDNLPVGLIPMFSRCRILCWGLHSQGYALCPRDRYIEMRLLYQHESHESPHVWTSTWHSCIKLQLPLDTGL